MSQVNTTDNVGFCMQVEKWVDWDNCINETENPNILVSMKKNFFFS